MTCNSYYPGYIELLNRLSSKAERCGYLDIEDLNAIAEWGNLREPERLLKNTTRAVRRQTSRAISRIHDPYSAIQEIMNLKGLDIVFGSKTLTLINPSSYAILDCHVDNALKKLLPKATKKRTNFLVDLEDRRKRRYIKFLNICSDLQCRVTGPCPEPHGQWRIAEIGQAIFQFGQSRGTINPGDEAG